MYDDGVHQFVITGHDPFRAAARDAVETLGHQIIRAEDFGASSSDKNSLTLPGVARLERAVTPFSQPR